VVVPGRLVTVGLFALSRIPMGVYNVSVSATIQTGVPDDRLVRPVRLTPRGQSAGSEAS
jgi:hypothetical protein